MALAWWSKVEVICGSENEMESVWTLLNSLNFIYQTFFTETFFWKRRTEKPETRNEWERTNFEFWYSSSWWWDARKSEMESHQIQHIIIIVISSVRQIKKSTKMCLLLYMYLYIKLYIYNIHIKLFAKKWARGFDHALASRDFFSPNFEIRMSSSACRSSEDDVVLVEVKDRPKFLFWAVITVCYVYLYL